MNLSPSQNNLLKTLAITPLQLLMPVVQPHRTQHVISQADLSINANLLLDLQTLLPQISQVSFGERLSIQVSRLEVPYGFNFDAAGKKQLWQFLQQQMQT